MILRAIKFINPLLKQWSFRKDHWINGLWTLRENYPIPHAKTTPFFCFFTVSRAQSQSGEFFKPKFSKSDAAASVDADKDRSESGNLHDLKMTISVATSAWTQEDFNLVDFHGEMQALTNLWDVSNLLKEGWCFIHFLPIFTKYHSDTLVKTIYLWSTPATRMLARHHQDDGGYAHL